MKKMKEFTLTITDKIPVKDCLYYGCHECGKTYESMGAWINHYVEEHMFEMKRKPCQKE